MRLAQIARKVKAKPSEIRSFVQTKFKVELDKDPNIKLEDDQVEAILKKFKVVEAPKKEAVKKKPVKVEVEPEIEIDHNIDVDLESLKEVAEVVATKVEIPEVKKPKTKKAEEKAVEAEKITVAAAKKKAVAIKHADPEELAKLKAAKDAEDSSEFKAVEVDENADLIAAEVEKLPGLKVLGKMDFANDKETKKLLEEDVDLPNADSIESEIDTLDGDTDTSEFTDLSDETADDKDALFAELDAAMEGSTNTAAVKPAKTVVAAEVAENTDLDEEDSIYKDAKGFYHFTLEQRNNRAESLELKKIKKRAQVQKEKKQRHYKENVAPKVAKKKKKVNPKKEEAKAAKVAKQAAAPTSLWGKFLRWLND